MNSSIDEVDSLISVSVLAASLEVPVSFIVFPEGLGLTSSNIQGEQILSHIFYLQLIKLYFSAQVSCLGALCICLWVVLV